MRTSVSIDEADIIPPYPTKDYSPNSMKARPASGFYIRNVKGIELHNVEVAFETPDPKPAMVASGVDGLVIDHFVVSQNPPSNGTIHLDHVTGLKVQNSPGLKAEESENVALMKK